MSGHTLVIGCVGKPSVGKSTFFNAVTEGKAKVGNFPFTTIEPNTGVTYFRAGCASVSRGKADVCVPRYGRLREEDGVRFIPVQLLDVAGLVPGASEGAGLGNGGREAVLNEEAVARHAHEACAKHRAAPETVSAVSAAGSGPRSSRPDRSPPTRRADREVER